MLRFHIAMHIGEVRITALRPLLPLGEGWGEGPQCKARRKRQGMSGVGLEGLASQGYCGALTRPSATLSQRERG